MDINLFRNHLSKITEKYSHIKEASIVTDKTDRKGINDADGWVKVKNVNFKDRALWLPDATDRSFWNSSELKKVYRFFVNDNPTNHSNYLGTGLVRLDIQAGTIQILDQDRYVKSGEKLLPSVWGRTYKVDEVVIFNKDFLKNQ